LIHGLATVAIECRAFGAGDSVSFPSSFN